jgi:hypothetical protein
MSSTARDNLLYSPLPVPGPGELDVMLFDGGTEFADIASMKTGLLERNSGFTSESDPDPAKRFRWNLRPGQFIENEDLGGIGTLSHAPALPADLEPFIWQSGFGIRLPAFDLRLPQLVGDAFRDLSRYRYALADCLKAAPIGQVLAGQGTENERLVDQFGQPAPAGPATVVLKARTGPGRFGLRYQEGTEATGSRNTNFRDPVTGRLMFGSEGDHAEPVEDVFFHAFDTTDQVNYKVTAEPYFWSREVLFGAPVGRQTGARLNLYLIPRQWFYYCLIIATYAIITLWDMYYHPLPISGSWWDRPPVHPVPFTGLNYMADLYGGMDDQGVYWKVTHSREFLSLLDGVHDFEMTSWLMGIVFIGIDTYYYRVRCFGAQAQQLCAVIEDAKNGARWYVWRRTQETKDAITLVDSKFWPEESAGAGGGF